MKKTIGCAAACLLCWAAVLAVCFGLLCTAAAVPDEKLAGNLTASCDKLAVHLPHEKTADSIYHSICDNYADAVLLGVAANMTSGDIPRSVIDTKYYDDDYGPAVGIRATLNGLEGNIDYTRYWHGSLIAVRPLLALTDISGIRLIGAVTVTLLIIGNAVLLLYRRHTAACEIFLISAAAVQFWFVYTTLEYMTVFIIMLLALPLYVRFAENSRALAVISAGVGTLTAFADFLTAETLTLLVPLTISFFINAESGEKSDGKKSLLRLTGCGAAWGAAYLMTFAAKWVIAGAYLGRDVTQTALAAAAERFGGSDRVPDSPAELLFSALGANFSCLTPASDKISVAGVIVWLGAFAAVCVILLKRKKLAPNLPKAAMIIIAALPVIRFGVLMNHSYLHNFFTYRALMTSIMAMLGLMWYRVGGKSKKTKQKN